MQVMSKPQDLEEEFIEIIGAKEHNLKNIDIKIPRNQLVVITGLSAVSYTHLDVYKRQDNYRVH